MKHNTDIDIDFGNRDLALDHLKYIKASITKTNGELTKHNTGVYFSDIPHDINNQSTIDYKQAEERGYFKIDLLNVSVYEQVKSEDHLIKLMLTEPPWERLLEKDYCEKLIHIGNYWSEIKKLSEHINSIPRLAMFIAAIRPAKKHLLGKPWAEVKKTIWEKSEDGSYGFKSSHSISYATLIVVHMNLLNGM
jgi:hypothetical protein